MTSRIYHLLAGLGTEGFTAVPEMFQPSEHGDFHRRHLAATITEWIRVIYDYHWKLAAENYVCQNQKWSLDIVTCEAKKEP
jgi:hypothetical protein